MALPKCPRREKQGQIGGEVDLGFLAEGGQVIGVDIEQTPHRGFDEGGGLLARFAGGLVGFDDVTRQVEDGGLAGMFTTEPWQGLGADCRGEGTGYAPLVHQRRPDLGEVATNDAAFDEVQGFVRLCGDLPCLIGQHRRGLKQHEVADVGEQADHKHPFLSGVMGDLRDGTCGQCAQHAVAPELVHVQVRGSYAGKHRMQRHHQHQIMDLLQAKDLHRPHHAVDFAAVAVHGAVHQAQQPRRECRVGRDQARDLEHRALGRLQLFADALIDHRQ